MNHFLHIIVNQQSRNSLKYIKGLLIELPKYTQHYKIHQTNNLGQLESLVKILKTSIQADDLIVFVGGDGSINQGVSLLEKYAVPNVVGYLPAGSGNDFARAHGIPNDVVKSLAQFFKIKEPQELSIIHATEGSTEHFAMNSLGVGIDGLVNHKIAEQKKDKGSGSLTYISSALSAFKQLEPFPFTLKVDDGIFQYEHAHIALIVNNAYFGGGLQIVPEANGKDDILEVLVAENANMKDLVSVFSRMAVNKSHLKNKKLSLFKTKQAAFYTESPQYGQKDGEVFKHEGYALSVTTKKRLFWL